MGKNPTAMIEEVLLRIEERLKTVNLSAFAASKAAGLSGDAIRNIRRAAEQGNGRGVTMRTLSALAAPLQTSASWLLTGELKNNSAKVEKLIAHSELIKVKYVPVVGFVQAGAWLSIPDLSDPLDYVPYETGQYDEEELFALRVVGNSMNKYYPDGSIVVCVRAISAGVREHDRVVLVRDDGTGKAESTLKEVVVSERGIEFWPRSTDPNHQVPFIPPLSGRDDNSLWEVKGIVLASVIKSPPREGKIVDIGS